MEWLWRMELGEGEGGEDGEDSTLILQPFGMDRKGC